MSEMPPPPPPPRNQPSRNPLKGFRDQKPGGDGKPPMPKWALWAIIAAVVVLAFGSQFISPTTGEKLSYTEFLVQVQDGNVKNVTINNATNVISGVLTNGGKFTTTRRGLLGQLCAAAFRLSAGPAKTAASARPSSRRVKSLGLFMLVSF